MPVAIRNRTRRQVIIILTHAPFCEMSGQCVCEHVGALTMPSARTIPALGTLGGLSDAVSYVPKVRSLAAAGLLEIRAEPPPAEPEKKTASERQRKGKR